MIVSEFFFVFEQAGNKFITIHTSAPAACGVHPCAASILLPRTSAGTVQEQGWMSGFEGHPYDGARFLISPWACVGRDLHTGIAGF